MLKERKGQHGETASLLGAYGNFLRAYGLALAMPGLYLVSLARKILEEGR